MIPALAPEPRWLVVAALGSAQTIGWASSYYLPAVLARPMAAAVGLEPVAVFAAFSAALGISALIGPWAGARIDRLGGRGLLTASNLVFATGLAVLAAAPGPAVMAAGWLILGIGMGIGLYEAGFATLAGIYGAAARAPITGITLIAGFASTIGWPLSAAMLAEWGWREACLGWAAIHLGVALPLNACLPPMRAAARGAATAPVSPAAPATPAGVPPPAPRALWLVALALAAAWFNTTAMAAHLPGLLQAAGASSVAAISAGTLIGPAQVAARLMEFGLMRRIHPLTSARLATAAHPLAALALLALGAPAAHLFAAVHGVGSGILTIAKGTLPLALFGPAGYGRRLGWLNAPARIMQAVAPLGFGAALAAWGADAIWLTAASGVLGLVALMALPRRPGAG